MELRALRPLERAEVQRLGVALFAPFGDYAEAMYGWLRHPGVRTVVAVEAGRPVGFALVTAVKREGYLLGIGVDEAHRRSGLGRLLLDEAIRVAVDRRQRWGISRIDLDVADDNAVAIALFESRGFERHQVRAERYVGGQAIVTMRLRLPRV